MYVCLELIKRFMDRSRVSIEFVRDDLLLEQFFPTLICLLLRKQILLALDASEGEQIGYR